MILLSTSSKIEKSNNAGLNYYSKILYLAPHKISGYNVCPDASEGCSSQCLNFAGMGRMNKIQTARINRTLMFYEDRNAFIEKLEKEIKAFVRKTPNKMKPVLRLNGYSDLPLETIMPNIFSSFPDIQFYDYTKSYKRMVKFLDAKMPKNYHLTFSRSEKNEKQCLKVLEKGGNVAVVFRNPPKKYWGYKVVDFDKHDLRFLDKGPIVGSLTPKGKARHDTTGFVV